MNPRGWPLWAGVIAHVLLSLLHGVAHLTIPVAVRDWQYGYAAVVIVIAPLVGAGLVAKGRTGTGAWLLALLGIGSLAFEGAFHFVVDNPDHVASVESGSVLFSTTAALTTLGDVIPVALGGWLLLDQFQGSSARSAIESST